MSDVLRNVAAQKYVAGILIPFLHTVAANNRRFRVHTIPVAPTTRIYSRPHFILAAVDQRRALHDERIVFRSRPTEEFFPLPSLLFILIHKNSRTVSRYLTSRKNKLRVLQVQQYYISRYDIRQLAIWDPLDSAIESKPLWENGRMSQSRNETKKR